MGIDDVFALFAGVAVVIGGAAMLVMALGPGIVFGAIALVLLAAAYLNGEVGRWEQDRARLIDEVFPPRPEDRPDGRA